MPVERERSNNLMLVRVLHLLAVVVGPSVAVLSQSLVVVFELPLQKEFLGELMQDD